MIWNYCKSAWRGIWKNTSTAVINIIGLSVGMTSAALIFLWVQNEISFDTNQPAANNIYRLTTNLTSAGWKWETTPLLLADAVVKEVPQVETAARLYSGDMPVFDINSTLSYEKKCGYVDDDWFKIFHFEFIEGSAAAFCGDPNSIILTLSAARKYFGGRPEIGTAIRVDSTNYVLKGVIQDAPSNSSFQYTAYIPLGSLLKNPDRRANDENWENANYITFIKVRPGTNRTSVTRKITGVLQQHSGDTEKQSDISLVNLKDLHFEDDLQSSFFASGNKNAVYIFSGLGILLLVIACINYVNLTTAKSSLRAKEVSVRKIVGANRIQLFCQFLAEAFLISGIAALATVVLVHFCVPAFNAITGMNFVLPFNSPSVWKVIGITLFSAFLLNSIYPALVLSSLKPLGVFRGFTIFSIRDSFLRRVLVIFQFAISVVLIAGTIIVYRQMQFIQQTNLGYNKSQVLITHLPPDIAGRRRSEIVDEIKSDLLRQSSIQYVTAANQAIVNIGSYSSGSADWNGRDTSFNPKIAQLSADPDFARALQLHMKQGRWFERGNQADKSNVVLNEEAIRELKIPSPAIGQRFTWKGKAGLIIGVVQDFKFHSLHDKTGPLVAFQNPSWNSTIYIRMAPNTLPQAITALNKTWHAVLPGSPLDYEFLDDTFNKLYEADQQASALLLVFAAIAVAISCLGLFGLATFTAEKRSKEIGIRKVLGASILSITRLLTTDFLRLVALAVIIAFPIGWWAMNKWLEGFAYRIQISGWTLIASGLLALMVAVITISSQAIRAAMADPVSRLRTE